MIYSLNITEVESRPVQRRALASAAVYLAVISSGHEYTASLESSSASARFPSQTSPSACNVTRRPRQCWNRFTTSNIHARMTLVLAYKNVRQRLAFIMWCTKYLTSWTYTVSEKNVPTLTSRSLDKHGLIFIIFGSISTLSKMICIFNFPHHQGLF